VNRILYLGVFLASALVLALGILFLCAAITVAERLPLALVLLVVGAIGAGWSAFAYRRWASLQPAALAARITSLAAVDDGEVALAQVMSEFGASAAVATTAFEELAQKGQCRRELRGDRVVYVFPGLKEHKMVRRCTYCGSTFPVKRPLQKCPNCGGSLELVAV
jgi:hypothetical protein